LSNGKSADGSLKLSTFARGVVDAGPASEAGTNISDATTIPVRQAAAQAPSVGTCHPIDTDSSRTFKNDTKTTVSRSRLASSVNGTLSSLPSATRLSRRKRQPDAIAFRRTKRPERPEHDRQFALPGGATVSGQRSATASAVHSVGLPSLIACSRSS
jgi:hypothetical protein